VGHDTTSDERRRARILVATGIVPGTPLTERAQVALDELAAGPDRVIDNLLALIHESKAPVESPEKSNRLHYPSPRLKARKPTEFPPGRPSH
jgi:hypothetical protein